MDGRYRQGRLYWSAIIFAYTDDIDKSDKSELETLVAKYEKQSGYEREVNNGKKVIADENASKNDITNAKLIIKAKAKEIKEQSLVIKTATDWKNFAKRVSGGESFAGKRVVLEKDIDFGGAKISAVGTASKLFAAILTATDTF